MKKILLVLIIAAAASAPLIADEVGGSFTIGNNNLTAAPLTTAVFPGTEFPWGATATWSQQANDFSGIEAGFTIDPLLRTIGYTNFYYNEDIFSIEVGPFFGLFNTTENLIKSGISTSMKLNIPGIAFAEFTTSSSIGGQLVSAGDYNQEANTIAVGFYVYNSICTLKIDTASYNYLSASLGTVSEDFIEYAFIADLFQKNVPYTVELKLAYQQRTRTVAATDIQTLSNVVLGTDFSISPFEFLSVSLGIDSGLYSFGFLEDTVAGTKDLLTMSQTFPGNFLFNATLGFTLDLGNINN